MTGRSCLRIYSKVPTAVGAHSSQKLGETAPSALHRIVGISNGSFAQQDGLRLVPREPRSRVLSDVKGLRYD
jgi:hypothetical protein